jgi:hypothetical protein
MTKKAMASKLSIDFRSIAQNKRRRSFLDLNLLPQKTKKQNSSNPALLASFYDQFIAAVGHRLSPLRLAQFAGAAATARAAASQSDDGASPAAAADAAAEFLEAVAAELAASVRHRSSADEGLDGPVLLLRGPARARRAAHQPIRHVADDVEHRHGR